MFRVLRFDHPNGSLLLSTFEDACDALFFDVQRPGFGLEFLHRSDSQHWMAGSASYRAREHLGVSALWIPS